MMKGLGGAVFLICVMNPAHLSEGKNNLTNRRAKWYYNNRCLEVWLMCVCLLLNKHRCLSGTDIFENKHLKFDRCNSIHREMRLRRYLLALLLSLTWWHHRVRNSWGGVVIQMDSAGVFDGVFFQCNIPMYNWWVILAQGQKNLNR